MQRTTTERCTPRAWPGALFLISTLAACGAPTYASRGLPSAPGADATVTVAARSTGDRQVELAVNHLPPPSRVERGASDYAVWIVPEDRAPVHAGTLVYDAGDRAGSLVLTTPYDVFTLLVTTQAEPHPLEPDGTVVVRQSISPPTAQ